VLETERVPPPAVAGIRCTFFCSWDSEALDRRDRDRPCSECYGVEITQGILHCEVCRREFPVIDGVPRFNPDAEQDYPNFFRRHSGAFRYHLPPQVTEFKDLHAQTKRSFGFQWLRYRVTDCDENRDHFFRRTGTLPEALGGQLFFEAGCGMGRYLQVIAEEPPAEVVGLDLSLAVNRAYAENRRSPFVHVIQGDILQLPLRPACFDHVYSIGVLHHTPNTKEAFDSIAKLVRPGGRISVWVYHVWRPPYLRGLKALHASIKGWIADNLRKVTTRLPLPILHYLCYLAIPAGWIQLQIRKAPAPIRALFSPLLLIPCSNHPRWDIRLLDTFDWYSPRFQWKHTISEVSGWFREAGIEEISTDGFPVSVRGKRPVW